MPSAQTIMPPPPFVIDKQIDPRSPLGQWLIQVQGLHPLRVVDTSSGSFAETTPPAGNNATSGLSNQNQEITYVKSSADGNTFTLHGVKGGDIVISSQFAFFEIKSDGTNWWRVG